MMQPIAEIVRARTVVTPLATDPDTLHGLLLLVEAGNPLRRIADVVDMQPATLSSLLERARGDEIRPASAYRGEPGIVPAWDAPQAWDRPERANRPKALFPVDWQREAIRLMLRSGGVTSRELSDMLLLHGVISDVTPALRGLRKGMNKAGLGFTVQPNARGSQTLYRIDGAWAERARKVIANGWRAVQ